MYRYFLLLMLMLLWVGGCNDNQQRLKESELERAAVTQKIELAEAAGGLVLMVGGETLTSDEIIHSQALLDGKVATPVDYFRPIAQALDIKQFKDRVRDLFEQVLMDNISNIMLYQYAKKQAGENIDEGLENAAQGEYRRFTLSFGGDQAKADEALKERGLDRKSFMDRVKKDILIRRYVTSKLPDSQAITHHELLECYEEMKDKAFVQEARIRFRLIDIQPDRPGLSDPNQDPQQFAEQRAGDLIARINSGEDFGALAKEYSHGPMAALGGLWQSVEPTSLRAPYDTLAATAEKMEQGEVAGPIEAGERIFIMKLEEKQTAGYKPFETVQDQVRQMVLQDRQNKALAPLYARMRRQAKLGRTDEFIDFCLEKIWRMSRQQQQKPDRNIEGQDVNK